MKQPNVLLVVMDTARADYVEDKRVMPNLHKLAKTSTWFPETFANAPWTLPSHSSLFTGQYPSQHGTTGAEKFFDEEQTLMSMLREEGYQTVSFSNNPWISPAFGFDDFNKFVPCWQPFTRGADLASISQKEGRTQQLRALSYELMSLEAPFTLVNAFYMKFVEGTYDSGAALTNFRFKRWFKNRTSSDPFFAFVNYMEPHLEYKPPRKYRKQVLSTEELEQWDDVNQDPWAFLTDAAEMSEADFELLQNLYRAELRYLDARLERLFDFLRDCGELDSTVVIVTGDHGEHLGEHDLMDHQYSLSDQLLRVPLLIRYPDKFDGGTRDDRLVELRDLYATILSLAGVDDIHSDDMESPPLDLTESDEGRDAVISEYLSPQPAIDTLCERYDVDRKSIEEYDRALRAIRTTDRKLVEGSDSSRQLYAVNDGIADETQPLNESTDELAARLQSVLGEFSVADEGTDSQELSESNKQRLEDLGYL